jgi:hypothetical protein
VFPYRIDFENEPTATAPAQRINVTDQLNTNLDWSTFQLTAAGFGDTLITIPAGTQHYQTTVPMTYNGTTFDVQVELGLVPDTGLVFARFLAVDPNTQLPPDVLTGFLPPEDGTGRGQGYFTYTILPRPGLPTGTQIRNVALVTFDGNPPIATDQVDDHDPGKGTDPAKEALNTIDAGVPSSSVSTLPPTETTTSFPVTWSGQDDSGGSGVATFDVYVSDNGGLFTRWQAATTATTANFTGQNQHTYSFYSVATDNVGNIQRTPTTAQATTRISFPAVSTTTSLKSNANPARLGYALRFTATVKAGSGTATPTGTVQFVIDGKNLGSAVPLVNGTATSPAISNLVVGDHAISALYVNTDGSFINSTGSLTGGQVVVSEAPIDFGGVGHSELAVFRPSTAQWFVAGGPALTTFGAKNLFDIPVVGDFDGVGHAEQGIFRPSTAQWFVLGPNGGHLLGTFGAKNLTDIPVPGDYDGTGRTEMAVFRPSTAQWFVLGPNGGHLLGTFGAKNLTDIPVPGDYDGTGKTEMAVFRPSTAQWFVLGPSGGRLLGTFGAKNLADIPVPGDYDGTGKTEMAVFRPSTAQWFVMGPNGGHLLGAFGATRPSDVPASGPGGALRAKGLIGSLSARSARSSIAKQAVAVTASELIGPPPQVEPNRTEAVGVASVDAMQVKSRKHLTTWLTALDELSDENLGRVDRS